MLLPVGVVRVRGGGTGPRGDLSLARGGSRRGVGRGGGGWVLI